MSKGVALADASLVTVRGLVPLPPSSLCDATSLVRGRWGYCLSITEPRSVSVGST